MQRKINPKTLFVSSAIRQIKANEESIYEKIKLVIQGDLDQIEISKIKGFVSQDGKERPLVFSSMIAQKIIRDHGIFPPENLFISATEWEYIIQNVDGNPDKINLIKKNPDSNNFLVIGANRNNGFFLLLHTLSINRKMEEN